MLIALAFACALATGCASDPTGASSGAEAGAQQISDENMPAMQMTSTSTTLDSWGATNLKFFQEEGKAAKNSGRWNLYIMNAVKERLTELGFVEVDAKDKADIIVTTGTAGAGDAVDDGLFKEIGLTPGVNEKKKGTIQMVIRSAAGAGPVLWSGAVQAFTTGPLALDEWKKKAAGKLIRNLTKDLPSCKE